MSGGLESMHLENVCRLCLTDASEAGDMFPIFPVRGGNPHSPTSVVNRILQCTSLRLEQTEGVPAAICELCSVRLEDWHAFREQCLGTDEYLRVTLRHAFYPDEGQTSHTSSTNVAIPVLHPNGNPLSKSTPIGGNESKTPSPPVSSRLTLAKRRQSTFEMPVSDGKGNTTDQKITVEVLGVCQDNGRRPSVPTFGALNSQQDNPNGFSTLDHSMLEQASWSREYCARINNLMVKVNGPRPFKCKVCRRMFNNRTNMRRHIKVLHSDEVFEGESPPPECYGYGDHGGPMRLSVDDMSRPPVKKKRKSTDPPIVGPYKCEVCPRSFKMPAHLAVHRKTHRQIEFDQSELSRAIEQQKRQMQQQQRERSSSAVSSEVDRTRKITTIEPCDVIQLSDDEEDDQDQMDKGLHHTAFGTGDDLDDGFDEEEGSLKESSSLDADLRPDPSSLAIVEIGAEDTDGPEQQVKVKDDEEEEDEDVLVVQDVESIAPASKQKAAPLPPPARAPPGPLSSKLKYNNQAASSSSNQLQQKPLIAARPIEDLQRKQSSSRASTPAGSVSKQKSETAGAASSEQQQPSSSTSGTATTVHRCHLCRHTFPREDLLRDHQKSHQHDSPCAYRCGWCKKGFRYRQNYTLHLEKQTCRLINADPVRTLQQQQQAGKCT